MDLSIIIVNWNSKEYLRNCIASILATTRGIEFEIVVIDNASFDGCDKMLLDQYPHVRFIQSEKNLGFAMANNAAFRESCGRDLLFLNPDTVLLTAAVNIMFDYLQRLPNAGAVSCKLLNADKTVQTSCIQSFPTILNQLLDSELLRALWPKSPLWGNAPLFGAQTGPEEVEAISGACIMVKNPLFNQVGLFSEDYFMYAEDMDLCYKIRQAGYKNYYVPNATIIHFGGGSAKKGSTNFELVTMRESNWWFLQKTRGKLYGFGYRMSTMISAIGRMVVLMVLLPMQIIQGNSEMWKTAFKKWGAILGWSLGFGNWLKHEFYPKKPPIEL